MMDTRHPEATLMFAEAAQAGDVVARFLRENEAALDRIAARLRAARPPLVITCARGSSDHAATFGKYLFETMVGVPVSSAALSTVSLFTAPRTAPGALCVAISQSGSSPDLLSSVEAQKAAGAFVVAMVNDATSPLAAIADEVFLRPRDRGTIAPGGQADLVWLDRDLRLRGVWQAGVAQEAALV